MHDRPENNCRRNASMLSRNIAVTVDWLVYFASCVASLYITGLCGFYNLDKADDLRKRNGDMYDGEGSGHGKLPKLFIDNWRYLTHSRNMC